MKIVTKHEEKVKNTISQLQGCKCIITRELQFIELFIQFTKQSAI